MATLRHRSSESQPVAAGLQLGKGLCQKPKEEAREGAAAPCGRRPHLDACKLSQDVQGPGPQLRLLVFEEGWHLLDGTNPQGKEEVMLEAAMAHLRGGVNPHHWDAVGVVGLVISQQLLAEPGGAGLAPYFEEMNVGVAGDLNHAIALVRKVLSQAALKAPRNLGGRWAAEANDVLGLSSHSAST